MTDESNAHKKAPSDNGGNSEGGDTGPNEAELAGGTDVVDARAISAGRAEGEVLRSSEPISFYGAVDLDSGEFIEEGHELTGANVSGRVLVFPRGKGSTVGSYVLYGLANNDVAPAAIVNEETETIVATGAILGEIPCVDSPEISLDTFATGDRVVVDANRGRVEWR